MGEGLDKDLQTLFRDSRPDFDAEPFVSATAKLIASQRARGTFARRLLQALGLVFIGLLSPLLIEGSLLLSSALDYLFDVTGRLLATPAGTIIAVLLAIPLILFNRKRIL